MAVPRRAGLFSYLKSAFVEHWNLLLFVGGCVAAAISPIPEIALPVVVAAETAYLAAMIGSDKYRRSVDAQQHAGRGAKAASSGGKQRKNQQSFAELITGLSERGRDRFERLQRRCRDMRAIASGVSGRSHRSDTETDKLSRTSLDRLLWVFLRLLYSQSSLDEFLRRTDEDRIRADLERTEARLAEASAKDDPTSERLVTSLRDSLATVHLRLDNYQKAQQNGEFVEIELDRIEGKIQALTEMAVNRQDPDFLSREVNSVAETMQQTEAAINELHLMDGLVDGLDDPPPILDSDLRRVFDEA